jgi:hypothetical protein
MPLETKPPIWPFELVSPFGRCILFVGEEMHIAGCTKRALTSLEHMPTVLHLVAQLLSEKGVDNKSIINLVRQTPDEWAINERQLGYLTIHRHSFLAMWGAIEAAIEEQFVLMIRNDATAFRATAKFLNASVTDIKMPLSEAKARDMFRLTNRDLSGNKNKFADCTRKLFALTGLPLSLNTKHDEVLNEAKEVRNCLSHRNGKIDSKSVARSPSLSKLLGQSIAITDEKFMRYYNSIEALMVAANDDAMAYIKARVEPNNH